MKSNFTCTCDSPLVEYEGSWTAEITNNTYVSLYCIVRLIKRCLRWAKSRAETLLYGWYPIHSKSVCGNVDGC